MPNTELPATVPTAKRGLYTSRSISGTATRVNTAADAIDTPVTAAKTAFPLIGRQHARDLKGLDSGQVDFITKLANTDALSSKMNVEKMTLFS